MKLKHLHEAYERSPTDDVLGYEVRELSFDHTQTHAAYGVHPNRVEAVKRELRKRGATDFRVTKSNSPNMQIVHFKL